MSEYILRRNWLAQFLQVDIHVTLRLREPLILSGSTKRPNLHLSCQLKPSEDVALMSGLLVDMILGKPCSIAPEPTVFAPPGEIPATVVYCVSKAEVETIRAVMHADKRLHGRVRPHFRYQLPSVPGYQLQLFSRVDICRLDVRCY
jgi:superfamily II DNA helicase RecQ